MSAVAIILLCMFFSLCSVVWRGPRKTGKTLLWSVCSGECVDILGSVGVESVDVVRSVGALGSV